MSQENYPEGWAKVTLMVSPEGEMHAIGGDQGPGDPRADLPYTGLERIKERMRGHIPLTEEAEYTLEQ